MAIYKLQKTRHEEGDLRDAKGNPIKFFSNAINRIACGQTKFGAKTGLSKDQEKHYEQELHLPPGTLNRDSEFWADWNVKVGAAGITLDDAEPKDALDLIVLKQREHIGTTLADAKSSHIKYILTSEDHDAKVAIDGRTYKIKAFSFLDKMTPEDLRNYLTAINRKTLGLSPEAIMDLVGREAEVDPKRFLEVANDPDKDLKVFINELVHLGVFYKQGSGFMDANTQEIVEYSVDALVDYFKDPKHQAYYITLQKELQKKKKAK